MSIKSRRKGAREENALVRQLQDAGLAAEKISRTGYAGEDISIPLLGIARRVEVKVRSHGFQQLYTWLEERDVLIVRKDRSEPLVVIRLKHALEIAIAAEKSRGTP
jgi:Holliday junction resolvase